MVGGGLGGPKESRKWEIQVLGRVDRFTDSRLENHGFKQPSLIFTADKNMRPGKIKGFV